MNIEYDSRWDSYTLEDFQNDPSWKPSLGEKLSMIHFRNNNWHAVCNPKTGECSIHYDEVDPHESLGSLVNHMSDSNLGAAVLVTVGVGILDQILTGGQLRKALFSAL